jgi:Rrf2 family protein
MNNLLRISEAASLGMHSMVLLAKNSERVVSTKEIASALHASEAHLSKVLQRLAKAGLVKPIRGPKGGFKIGKRSHKVTLLNVYESIESPIETNNCLFDTPICKGKNCILGGLLNSVNKQVRRQLAKTKLSELANVY